MYQPKNILLTGGAGFIGSNMVRYLVKKYKYNIIVLDKLDYCSNVDFLKDLMDLRHFEFIQGDILSRELVRYILKVKNIDTIMHFAAQTHVDNSFGNSIEFTKNNVLGTHVLLECAREHSINRFIHVSTDEVYGESSFEENAGEGSIMLPTNPYAATKAGAELIVRSYYKTYKLPIIITRGNNVYGPRQYPEKLIPKFICLLNKGKECCIHGNGQHSRSFIYIQDVVNAFDTILHKGVVGEIYNIGTNQEYTTIEITKKLCTLMGKEEKIVYCEDRKFNDLRYMIDSEKLKSLGWKVLVDIETGLKETIKWYLDNMESLNFPDTALLPHPVFKNN